MHGSDVVKAKVMKSYIEELIWRDLSTFSGFQKGIYTTRGYFFRLDIFYFCFHMPKVLSIRLMEVSTLLSPPPSRPVRAADIRDDWPFR